MGKVSIDFIKPYITASHIRHIHYEESVKRYEALMVHANGYFPKRLIDGRRPAETEKIQKYREEIFVPITKSTMTQVISSLSKIEKAQDWHIYFNPELPPRIPEDESPEKYLVHSFPDYYSLTEWLFRVCLKQYCIDSNGVILVMPKGIGSLRPNEFLRPYPIIFNSDQILDFVPESYYVLLSKEHNSYNDGGHTFHDGKIVYVVTDTHIQRFETIRRDGTMTEAWAYPHGLDRMPIVGLQGVVVEATERHTLYDSRLAGMVAGLDEAAREYSDLQAEVVQHIHSTMWAYEQQDCRRCKGSGFVLLDGNVQADCPACNGKGLAPFNPYEFVSVRAATAGETTVPTPPLGYVQKDTTIVEVQDRRIQQHIYNALTAIAMQFLAQVPVSQSGVAKAYDRSEAINFVYSVASDLVRIYKQIADLVVDYRYKDLIPNRATRYELCPTLVIPTRYDILGEDTMLDSIQKMRTAEVDPSIIAAAQVQFANKMFNTNPLVGKMVQSKLKLDPFGGVTDDEILARLAAKTIRKEDAVIHSNITAFIERAYTENEGFNTLTHQEQYAVLYGYAEELLTDITGKEPEVEERVEFNPE